MFYKFSSGLRSEIKIIILLVFLISGPIKIRASDSLSFINGLKLTLKLNHGLIIPHHNSIEYLLNKKISGLEIQLTTQSYGRTEYDQLYRYPRFGIGFLATSLGNDEVLGNGYALFGLMDFPFSKFDNKLSVNYQIDFGISYLNKQYNPETNLMNVAISSALNLFAGMDFSARYRINKKNEIQAGIKVFHFSNGKLATPNLGINSVVLSLGYIYAIKPAIYEKRKLNSPINRKKNKFDVVLSAGAKADDQITDKYYFITSLVFDYKYYPSIKYGYGIGTDFFYDASIGPNMVAEIGGEYSTSDLFQAGIHAGIYPNYSKLTIILQYGYYLYSNFNKYADFYSRIGFRYKIYNNLLFNMTLKSHYAIADFLEWGVGYSF